MNAYVSFEVSDAKAPPLLIEVDERAIAGGAGVRKAGLAEAAGSMIAQANQQFRKAIAAVVEANVDAFIATLAALEKPPTSAEISFGLKVSGEAGNFVVTKVAAEGSYSVKLIWTSK